MWPWRKKKDPEQVAIAAIKAIRMEAKAAVHLVERAGIEVRGAQMRMVTDLERDLNTIVKKFSKDIDEILGAHMIRSLDSDDIRGEKVATPEFTDLDSRAVFANPYAIPDPDFSAHFEALEQSIEKDK